MLEAFRLCKAIHAATAFSGDGAALYGGRWNPPGMRCVYLASSIALAQLEVLVHASGLEPRGYVVVRVSIPDGVARERIALNSLGEKWRSQPPTAETQLIGEEWLRKKRSCVLEVPSAVVPQEQNLLLNPEHREFGALSFGSPEPIEFDARLFSPRH